MILWIIDLSIIEALNTKNDICSLYFKLEEKYI